MFTGQVRLGSALHKRVFLGCCGLLLSVCSASVRAGLFDSDNLLHSTITATSGEVKNAAVLRITPYLDQRGVKNPRLLGMKNTRVIGMSGDELVLDQDVATIVTIAMQNQFKKAGFEVLAADSAQQPTFELTGVIKKLTLDSKARDEMSLAIETNVQDLATGKIIWSGLVTEKNDRFAGVAGNSKSDLVDYLNSGLRIVDGKTVEAVNGMLMATYPALFNLTPGTKAIAGVQVNSAPVLTAAPVASAPVVSAAAPAVAAVTGSLKVTSKPSHAKVYVDEVYFGMTPLSAEIEAGVHHVEVKLDGHKTISEKVSVRRGDATELELNLKH